VIFRDIYRSLGNGCERSYIQLTALVEKTPEKQALTFPARFTFQDHLHG